MEIWGNELPKGAEKTTEVFVKEPSILEEVDNRIYFYAEIWRENILRLNRTLRSKGTYLFSNAQIQEAPNPVPIYLHINSYGGNVFDGLAGMDEILKCKVPVTTIIDGCCASAATFLSVAGTKRLINKHAFMLIHQLSAISWGKYEELKDDMKNYDKLMKTIKDVYKKHTKIPMKKLEEILKHDLWFDANQCLEYGLVDEII